MPADAAQPGSTTPPPEPTTAGASLSNATVPPPHNREQAEARRLILDSPLTSHLWLWLTGWFNNQFSAFDLPVASLTSFSLWWEPQWACAFVRGGVNGLCAVEEKGGTMDVLDVR